MKSIISCLSFLLVFVFVFSFVTVAQTPPVKIRPITAPAPAENKVMTIEQQRMVEIDGLIKNLMNQVQQQQKQINDLKQQVSQLSGRLSQSTQHYDALLARFNTHYHSLSPGAVLGNQISNNQVMMSLVGSGQNASDKLKELRKTGPPVE